MLGQWQIQKCRHKINKLDAHWWVSLQSQESVVLVYLVSELGKKFSPPYLFQRIVNVWDLNQLCKTSYTPRESGLFVAGLLGSALPGH